MLPPYEEVLGFVQEMAPTWRKEVHDTCAQLICALWDRSALCLRELGLALPEAEQALHGRLKRVQRWLDNPHVDEVGRYARWLCLAYHFGDAMSEQPGSSPLLPIVLDTVSFEPFAALVASVPCGSRSMPVALTTYHRTELVACFPPRARWPGPYLGDRHAAAPPAASQPTRFWSQNHIEAQLIDLVWNLLSPALRGVVVMDRGFARASLFEACRAHGRDGIIRIDAQTHVTLPGAAASRPVAEAVPLQPGARRWLPEVGYQQEARVPLGLLGVWAPGAKEPWYLGTTLERPDWTEQAYAWRMRCSVHASRLQAGLAPAPQRGSAPAHQRAASAPSAAHPGAGRMARRTRRLAGAGGFAGHGPSTPAPDRGQPTGTGPAAGRGGRVSAAYPPRRGSCPMRGSAAAMPARAAARPAATPRSLRSLPPHRGPHAPIPPWLRRFTSRGPLSPIRLGWEILQAPDLRSIVRRLLRWLDFWLGSLAPAWSPAQRRYRRRHGWPDARAA